MRRSCPRWWRWRSAPDAAPHLDTRRPSGMQTYSAYALARKPHHTFRRHATSPLLFMARGTPTSPIVPALDSEGARNAGRPIASAASCAWVEFGHTSFSHHESTVTSGVPHAVVFSACFVLSPANGRNLSPSGLSCTVRPLSERMVSCGPHGNRRSIPLMGPHDLGRRAKRCQWGASPPRPHRAAWSSASAQISHAPPESERPSTGGNRRAPGLRPKPYASA
jgi:hypothetical protein